MIKGYSHEVKTLGEWIEELEITEAFYIFPENTYDTYKSAIKKDRHGYIDIYKGNGYGLSHSELESFKDKSFRMMNNDINDAKLVEVCR